MHSRIWISHVNIPELINNHMGFQLMLLHHCVNVTKGFVILFRGGSQNDV